MAGFAYKYLAFLAVVHVLLFQAQGYGYISNQSPENPHKKYIDEFASGNLTDKTTVSEDSGIIQDTFSPITAVADLINNIVGILKSPYSSIDATALPKTLKLLFKVLTGLSEMYVGYKFIRGGA